MFGLATITLDIGPHSSCCCLLILPIRRKVGLLRTS